MVHTPRGYTRQSSQKNILRTENKRCTVFPRLLAAPAGRGHEALSRSRDASFHRLGMRHQGVSPARAAQGIWKPRPACDIKGELPCRSYASLKELRWTGRRPLRLRSRRSSGPAARAPSCGSARTSRSSRSRRSHRARSGWTSRSVLAGCRAAAWSRSMGRNPQARPRWRCMWWPRRRSGGACAASSMPSTRSTRSMRGSSAWIWRICSSRSPTRASRRLRSPTRWCAPAPSTCWSSIRWRR